MPTIKKTQQQGAVRQRTTEGNWSERCTNHSRGMPSNNSWAPLTRYHRRKKTSSLQSKYRDLHPKWPHCETNDYIHFWSVIYHDEYAQPIFRKNILILKFVLTRLFLKHSVRITPSKEYPEIFTNLVPFKNILSSKKNQFWNTFL